MRARNVELLAALILGACAAVVSAGERAKPLLSPTLDAQLPDDRSVVYCPTFQVAWDKLKGVVGGPIGMKSQPALVKTLNDSTCPAGVLPEQAYVAMAGLTSRGIVDKIQQALRQKFGEHAPPLPPAFSDPRTAIVTYCHLQRNLRFPQKFVRSRETPLLFAAPGGDQQVQFFGVPRRKGEKYAEQIRILRYRDQDAFTLKLSSKTKSEFIVLTKMPRPKDLGATVRIVMKHIKAPVKDMHELTVNGKEGSFMSTLGYGDSVRIPVVSFNVARELAELCGKPFTNKGFAHRRMARAYQDVKFRMNESGATLRSTAFGSDEASSSKPRRFAFDKPFLLTLWQEDAKLPYLAVWIGAADVMLPFVRRRAK